MVPNLNVMLPKAMVDITRIVLTRPWNEPYMNEDGNQMRVCEKVEIFVGENVDYAEYRAREIENPNEALRSYSLPTGEEGLSVMSDYFYKLRSPQSAIVLKEQQIIYDQEGVGQLYQKTEYTYNASNQLTKERTEFRAETEQYPIHIIEYTYGADGKPTKGDIYNTTRDGSEKEIITEITYDANGKKAKEEISIGNIITWSTSANDMGGTDSIMNENSRYGNFVHVKSYDAQGFIRCTKMGGSNGGNESNPAVIRHWKPWTEQNSADVEIRTMGSWDETQVVMTKHEGSRTKDYIRNGGEWILICEGTVEVLDGNIWVEANGPQCPSVYSVTVPNWTWECE